MGKGFDPGAKREKVKVVSITGGGIHPVAKKIAEAAGTVAVDGFNNSVPEEEIMCVVIDCGGTARIGVYPMKGIPTVDVLPSSPSGPLAKHITEHIFVSGTTVNDIKILGEADGAADTEETVSAETGQQAKTAIDTSDKEKFQEQYQQIKEEHQEKSKDNILTKFSRGIGQVTGTFYQAGRESVGNVVEEYYPIYGFRIDAHRNY